MNELWVNYFVPGVRPHNDWLLDIDELLLLLLYWSVYHVALGWLHVNGLWLHNVSDWLRHWHRMNLLLLLLRLCLGLLFRLDILPVGLQVARQVELGEESTLAVLTSESLLSLVDLHMLVQVGFLSECMVAVRERAFVGSLLSVDS